MVNMNFPKITPKKSWRTGKTAGERGYNYRWRQARLRHLNEYPLCLICQKKKCTTAATVVDHIIPHRGDQALFWDESNWQSLCKRCHDGDKATIDRTGKAPIVIGLDGYPMIEGWGT